MSTPTEFKTGGGYDGNTVEIVRLKGGKFDGLAIALPHGIPRADLDDHRYYRSHRRADGDAQFVHQSIHGRIT